MENAFKGIKNGFVNFTKSKIFKAEIEPKPFIIEFIL